MSSSPIEFEGLGEGLTAATPYLEALAKCRVLEESALLTGDLSAAARARRGAAECYRRVGRTLEAREKLDTTLGLFRLTNVILLFIVLVRKRFQVF